MKAIIATVALGAAFALAGTVPGAAGAASGSPGHMKPAMTRCPGGWVLNAVGGSGESGCATAHAVMGSMLLGLKVTGEAKHAIQPSHIHRGTCGSNGPVVIPLSNVVHGMSSTKIPMAKWKMVNHGGFSINIHESADTIPHVVSCANITAMAMHRAM
ncbi:MAG: hypothetical protein M3154_00915 [Candidatus Eremiobacteraeota bacterium]|nr:hypothetical protein [Candidatus Eremiobacteraeota bacterium]